VSPLSASAYKYYKTDKAQYLLTHPEASRYDYYHGVAQGSPISPLLSLLPISKELLTRSDCKVVQYADDGLLYDYLSPPEIILSEAFGPHTGISYHPGKSHILRQSGT
jgi:hypothetical protein